MKFTWALEIELDEEAVKEWFYNFHKSGNVIYASEAFRCLADQLDKQKSRPNNIPDNIYFAMAQQVYDWFIQWRDEGNNQRRIK